MILKGSQRSGGSQLAAHLMNIADNDHITLYEVRGFVAQSLHGAFNEADAISKATKCKQFLFSLSFNPPGNADVSVENFLSAINRAEEKLGLNGQPRAIVFHEKEGRRHAHVVWSRIDAQQMKAINLPFFKMRLNSLSKEQYLENGWELPRGHRENNWKNPLNFTLAEWQQAKRLDMDPREIKQVFHEAFQQSDSAKAFKAALEEQGGYYLARGDRRGMVAVDLQGKVYSVARWAGIKTKELRAKFGQPDNLPSVDQTRSMISQTLSKNAKSYMKELRSRQREQAAPVNTERRSMIKRQRQERVKLNQTLDKRWKQESKQRGERYRSGLAGAFDILIGKRRQTRKENERDTIQCQMRDRNQRETLFKSQMKERKALQVRIKKMRAQLRDERRRFIVRMADVLSIIREQNRQPDQARQRNRDRGFDLSP